MLCNTVTVEKEALEVFRKRFPFNPHKHGLFHSINPRTKEKKCSTKDQPVTPELLQQHLEGSLEFRAIGYLPGGENSTSVGVVDIDNYKFVDIDAFDDAKRRLYDVLAERGIHYYPERSSRGGEHVWLFFEEELPYHTMRLALRSLLSIAGLPEDTETFPGGTTAKGTWIIMPYAEAAKDPRRLGRTYLETDAGQPIPFDELDEYITCNPVSSLTDLADDEPAHTPSISYDLTGDDFVGLCQAALTPPATFPRHESISAFLNLAERMGKREEMVAHLGSVEVYNAWVKDNSRSHDTWQKEVKRWLNATSSNKRGYPFLTKLGFTLPAIKQSSLKQGIGVSYNGSIDEHDGEEIVLNDWQEKGKRWLYSSSETKWYEYVSPTYVQRGDDEVLRAIDRTLTSHGHRKSETFLKSVKAKIQRHESILRTTHDSHPHLVPVANGILNLKTGELLDPSPKYFFLDQSPVVYDPEASCPKWLTFLNEAVPAADQQATLQEFFGYMLSGDTKYQKGVYIKGIGGSGKSTMVSAFQHVLGSFADNRGFEMLREDSHYLEGLQGKRLLYISEVTNSPRSWEFIKKVTGEDQIVINPKGKKVVRFKLEAKVLITANEFVYLGEDSHNNSIDRRFMVFLFEKKPAVVNHNLGNELEEEQSGILNWAVEGYRRLELQRGFTLPCGDPVARLKMQERSNPLLHFLQEHYQPGVGSVTQKSVFENAEFWFHRSSRVFKYKSQSFGGKLEDALGKLGWAYERRDANKGMVIEGLVEKDPVQKSVASTIVW